MKYYEVRYQLYDESKKSTSKHSMPICALNKTKAYEKFSQNVGIHSVLYISEISYLLYKEWTEINKSKGLK